jgi:hypothetical protein
VVGAVQRVEVGDRTDVNQSGVGREIRSTGYLDRVTDGHTRDAWSVSAVTAHQESLTAGCHAERIA